MGFLVRSRKDRLQKEEDVKAHIFYKGFNWADCKSLKMKPPLVPKSSKKDPYANFSDEFTELPMTISPTEPKELSQVRCHVAWVGGCYGIGALINGAATGRDPHVPLSPRCADPAIGVQRIHICTRHSRRGGVWRYGLAMGWCITLSVEMDSAQAYLFIL